MSACASRVPKLKHQSLLCCQTAINRCCAYVQAARCSYTEFSHNQSRGELLHWMCRYENEDATAMFLLAPSAMNVLHVHVVTPTALAVCWPAARLCINWQHNCLPAPELLDH